MTWSPELFVRRTHAELDAAGAKSMWGEERSSWVEGNLVGTPEQVADKIQTYLDLGCRGFVPWCSDYPDTESLELFATEVVPNFRARSTGSIEPGEGGTATA